MCQLLRCALKGCSWHHWYDCTRFGDCSFGQVDHYYVFCPEHARGTAEEKGSANWRLAAVLQITVKDWFELVHCASCDLFDCVHVTERLDK